MFPNTEPRRRGQHRRYAGAGLVPLRRAGAGRPQQPPHRSWRARLRDAWRQCELPGQLSGQPDRAPRSAGPAAGTRQARADPAPERRSGEVGSRDQDRPPGARPVCCWPRRRSRARPSPIIPDDDDAVLERLPAARDPRVRVLAPARARLAEEPGEPEPRVFAGVGLHRARTEPRRPALRGLCSGGAGAVVGPCRAAGPGSHLARDARAASPRLRCRARGSGARAGAPAPTPPGAADQGHDPRSARQTRPGAGELRRVDWRCRDSGRSRLHRQRLRLGWPGARRLPPAPGRAEAIARR